MGTGAIRLGGGAWKKRVLEEMTGTGDIRGLRRVMWKPSGVETQREGYTDLPNEANMGRNIPPPEMSTTTRLGQSELP